MKRKDCLSHLHPMPSFVPCDYHFGRVKAVSKDCKTLRQMHYLIWTLQGLSLLLAEEQTDCTVYATDGLGDDISSSIAYVTSNPACSAAFAGDLACPQCAVEYMQQGLCLPARYDSSPILRRLLLLTVHGCDRALLWLCVCAFLCAFVCACMHAASAGFHVCLDTKCALCHSKSQPSTVKISYDQMGRMKFQMQHPFSRRISDTTA